MSKQHAYVVSQQSTGLEQLNKALDEGWHVKETHTLGVAHLLVIVEKREVTSASGGPPPVGGGVPFVDRPTGV